MSERQSGSKLQHIRSDHITRYNFAIDILNAKSKTGYIIDAGCGIGYGSWLLSSNVQHVDAIDYSEEAELCFKNHWERPNIDFHKIRVEDYHSKRKVDAVVCFEFIEHTHNYKYVIEQFAAWSDFLIMSSPNQNICPHVPGGPNPYHVKHFTPIEMTKLLSKYGFVIESWHNQLCGSRSKIRQGHHGKFMILQAKRK